MKSNKPIPRDDQWSAEDVARVICNPAHVFNGTIAPDQWVKAVVKMVENRNGDVESVYRRIMLCFDEAVDGRGIVEQLIADQGWPNFQKAVQAASLEQAFGQLLADLARGAEIILQPPNKGPTRKWKKRRRG